jgi:hypothetical protein
LEAPIKTIAAAMTAINSSGFPLMFPLIGARLLYFGSERRTKSTAAGRFLSLACRDAAA